MIQITEHPVFPWQEAGSLEAGRRRTMTWQILQSHNLSEDPMGLELRFDALVSPDNNYVNILQTARASGLERFPVPYILSNCHHTLCAVGGTIQEDDHVFGLDCVKKYGGIYLPPHRGVLHQYMRECWTGSGKLILGSDSHTRYGALGTMGIGEGGGEVAKQLLGRTYDLSYPQVVAVELTGMPRPGIGPMDVALALIRAAQPSGFLRNKVLEFIGEGIRRLSVEFRMGIDVMTTETGALSSIWCTDEPVKRYLENHGRPQDYAPLSPGQDACYDGMIRLDLGQVESMIALPFHPGNAMPIRQFLKDPETHLRHLWDSSPAFRPENHIKADGFYIQQALISGCAGGMTENLVAAADILQGYSIPGKGVQLGLNPASLPVLEDLTRQGIAGELMRCGATLRPPICGPCFGVTDVPANGQLSIRHVTRNFLNREGSVPGQGQQAAVFLMDARSIAATVRMGGRLTPATDLDVAYRSFEPGFDPEIYRSQVFDNFGSGDAGHPVTMGPNIADWPAMPALGRHLLLQVAASFSGSISTDDLLPSGEASAYRSNPERISEYTLRNRDPGYTARAKQIRDTTPAILEPIARRLGCPQEEIGWGSLLCAQELGEGSSREQAASCQKVLGGAADLAGSYATKRYRSNCVNWGILPLSTPESPCLPVGTWVLLEDIHRSLEEGVTQLTLTILDSRGEPAGVLPVELEELTAQQRSILLDGCLINYYRRKKG